MEEERRRVEEERRRLEEERRRAAEEAALKKDLRPKFEPELFTLLEAHGARLLQEVSGQCSLLSHTQPPLSMSPGTCSLPRNMLA